jgi:hypothetical protein
MKIVTSLLLVALLSVTLSSCLGDYESLTIDRTTADYSGMYSDTLTIKAGSRYIIDTVIQKTLTRINDSTYEMAYAFGDPNFPLYAPTNPVVIHIRYDNFVWTELFLYPVGPAWMSTGFADPTRRYIRIETVLNSNPVYPIIDKLQKL